MARPGAITEVQILRNDRRDSIRSVSFPSVKPREGMKNIIVKKFNLRDERVRGW